MYALTALFSLLSNFISLIGFLALIVASIWWLIIGNISNFSTVIITTIISTITFFIFFILTGRIYYALTKTIFNMLKKILIYIAFSLIYLIVFYIFSTNMFVTIFLFNSDYNVLALISCLAITILSPILATINSYITPLTMLNLNMKLIIVTFYQLSFYLTFSHETALIVYLISTFIVFLAELYSARSFIWNGQL